jgi:hypothetical protein
VPKQAIEELTLSHTGLVRYDNITVDHLLLHDIAASRLVLRFKKIAKRRVQLAGVDHDCFCTPRSCTVHLHVDLLAEIVI